MRMSGLSTCVCLCRGENTVVSCRSQGGTHASHRLQGACARRGEGHWKAARLGTQWPGPSAREPRYRYAAFSHHPTVYTRGHAISTALGLADCFEIHDRIRLMTVMLYSVSGLSLRCTGPPSGISMRQHCRQAAKSCRGHVSIVWGKMVYMCWLEYCCKLLTHLWACRHCEHWEVHHPVPPCAPSAGAGGGLPPDPGHRWTVGLSGNQ